MEREFATRVLKDAQFCAWHLLNYKCTFLLRLNNSSFELAVNHSGRIIALNNADDVRVGSMFKHKNQWVFDEDMNDFVDKIKKNPEWVEDTFPR